MAPARGSGQLDQISEAIGRISGQVEALDRYTHEREHGIRDLSAKIDGVGALVSREVTKLKVELRNDIDQLSKRVDRLEETQAQTTGAKNLAVVFLQSPLIAWLFAIAVVAWTTIKGQAK